MPSRQPRWPSIGLNSCSSCTRRAIASAGTPIFFGQLGLLLARRAAGTRAAADRAGGSSPAGPSSRGTGRRSPSRWKRQQLGQRLFAVRRACRPGSSRGIRRCGRRTCARCGTGRCPRRRRRSPRAAWFGLVGVGADLAACGARRPRSSAGRSAGTSRTRSGFSVLSISTCTISLGLVATWPAKTSPVKPSMRDGVAVLEHLAADGHACRLV